MILLPDGQQRHCVVFGDIVNLLAADFGVRKYRVVQEAIDKFHWYVDCDASADPAKLLLVILEKTEAELNYRPRIELEVGPIPSHRAGKFTDFVALGVRD